MCVKELFFLTKKIVFIKRNNYKTFNLYEYISMWVSLLAWLPYPLLLMAYKASLI